MSKPRFIRSSQEDFLVENNPYGLESSCINYPININKVISIYHTGANKHRFEKKRKLGEFQEYVPGYQIHFDIGNDYTIIWSYLNEIMRDSDYGRILELFEVKL